MNSETQKLLVLVSGGTRGLGISIVGRLARNGYKVIAAGRKNSNELKKICSEYPDQVSYEELHLERTSDLHSFINGVTKKYGPLYSLVNNAAIAHDGVLATMHESQINEIINVNVLGTIILTKYAIRSMLANRCGRVVNIASIIGSTGFSGLSVYGASKAALLGFTRSLSRELGRMGVTVNAVSPGYMRTDMTAGLDDEKIASIERRSALRTLVETDDVASGIAYLLSSDARNVTGIELTIDAGSTA